MDRFAQGEIKILICTNIVESGLDIQNANTIIIQEVQQFGLAQLYQVLLFILFVAASFLSYFVFEFPNVELRRMMYYQLEMALVGTYCI